MTKNQPAIDEILTRGVAEVLPDRQSLADLMAKRKIRLYFGIDPTGALLHLGHAVGLRKIQQFADLGHQVILLIGNGTVKIGDPTGRDSSRPVLTDTEIEKNFQNWKKQASKILDFSKIEIRRNGDWLDKLALPDLIKLMAKTTIQQLIERDMFQERIKKGLPIHTHEILYPLLQGYDSVVMDVDLECGGTDQTFNMMMGRTLQKIYHNKNKWVLTWPIINGTDGRKMSKSFNNYISLTAKADDIYGKIMSIHDDLIIEYFTLLTNLPLTEIETMKKALQQGENPMRFKKQLALKITADLHDQKPAQLAQECFEKTIQAGELPAEIQEVKLPKLQLNSLAVIKACLPQESNSHLKRLIEQQAVILLPQNKKISDAQATIKLTNGQVIKIGKRKFFKIKI